MELLLALVFCTALFCSNAQSQPLVVSADCNDTEKDAGMALDLINKHRRDGYVFSLLRVADAHTQLVGNASIFYFTLDVLETDCPVISRKHWQTCGYGPFGPLDFGRCNAVIYINQQLKRERLYGYNCTISPVPPQLYECKDCPVRITVLENVQQYAEEAERVLERYNQDSKQTNYFKVDQVTKVLLAVASHTAYYVEFTIKETTCPKTKLLSNMSGCEFLPDREAHTGFCIGTVLNGTKSLEDVEVRSCEIYDIQLGRHPIHGHPQNDSGEYHHHCNISSHRCRQSCHKLHHLRHHRLCCPHHHHHPKHPCHNPPPLPPPHPHPHCPQNDSGEYPHHCNISSHRCRQSCHILNHLPHHRLCCPHHHHHPQHPYHSPPLPPPHHPSPYHPHPHHPHHHHPHLPHHHRHHPHHHHHRHRHCHGHRPCGSKGGVGRSNSSEESQEKNYPELPPPPGPNYPPPPPGGPHHFPPSQFPLPPGGPPPLPGSPFLPPLHHHHPEGSGSHPPPPLPCGCRHSHHHHHQQNNTLHERREDGSSKEQDSFQNPPSFLEDKVASVSRIPLASEDDVLQAPGADFSSPSRNTNETVVIQPFPLTPSESESCPGKPTWDPRLDFLSLYPPPHPLTQ